MFPPLFFPWKEDKGAKFHALSELRSYVFHSSHHQRPFLELSFCAPLPTSSTSSWGQEISKRKRMINTAGFVVFQILIFFPKPYAIYFSKSLSSCSTLFQVAQLHSVGEKKWSILITSYLKADTLTRAFWVCNFWPSSLLRGLDLLSNKG